jgi:hypothetical protein
MDLSWSVDRIGDASLVRCRVRSDEAVPRRVRVESRFDVPVLPPRRAGAPADGWDATGVTLRVEPGERRGFGFAVPAPPVDPPVAIAAVEPVDSDASAPDAAASVSGGGDGDQTAVHALRELAEHRPPRTAIDGVCGSDGDRRDVTSVEDAPASDVAGGDAESDDTESGDAESDDTESGDAESDDIERDTDGAKRAHGPKRAASDADLDRFAAVEARLDLAERLTDADVTTATEAVGEAGGVDAVARLDDRIGADAERLRAVSERAASLAERAEATDVPVGALERLA